MESIENTPRMRREQLFIHIVIRFLGLTQRYQQRRVSAKAGTYLPEDVHLHVPPNQGKVAANSISNATSCNVANLQDPGTAVHLRNKLRRCNVDHLFPDRRDGEHRSMFTPVIRKEISIDVTRKKVHSRRSIKELVRIRREVNPTSKPRNQRRDVRWWMRLTMGYTSRLGDEDEEEHADEGERDVEEPLGSAGFP